MRQRDRIPLGLGFLREADVEIVERPLGRADRCARKVAARPRGDRNRPDSGIRRMNPTINRSSAYSRRN